MNKISLLTMLLPVLGTFSTMAQTRDDLLGATADNPKDATALIINAQCDSIGGWNFVGPVWGLQTASYTNGDVSMAGFFERWVRAPQMLPDGYFYQTIHNLPKGVYRFSAANMGTQQSNAGASQTGTYLFARHDAGGDSTVVTTANGVPQRFNVDFELAGDGDISIGFGTYATSCNWVAADNFTLTYYGEGTGLFKSNLLNTMDNLRTKEEMQIYTGLLQEIETELATGEALYADASATRAQIDAEIAKMDSLMDEADLNAAAYTRLVASIDSAGKVLGLDPAKFDLTILDGYLTDNAIDDVVDSYSASTSKCDELTKGIYDAIARTFYSGIKEGEDATFILNNPSFDNGAVGWNYTGGAPGLSFGEAEMYNRVFDIYQEFDGVPNGTYTLQVQAFLRTNDNATAYNKYKDGIAEVKTMAYVNKGETPVANVMAYASDVSLGQDDYQNVDGTWTPNNMAGAAEYMKKGYYETIVQGIVTDGKLRIGIKLQDATGYGSYWNLFDNFRLTYNGADMSQMKALLEKAVATAEGLYAEPMCSDSLQSLKNAVAEAQAALTGTTLAAALTVLDNAIVAANSSAQTYATLTSALSDSRAKVTKYKSEGGNYTTSYNEVESALLNGSYADADIPAELIKVKTFTNAYLLEDVTGTVANPADVSYILDNASFDDNSHNGWSFDGSLGAVYLNLQEFFNTNFNMYQKVYGMKPGMYKLDVQGFYRCGDYRNLGTDLNAKIYLNDAETSLMSIKEGAYEGTTPGSVIFDAEAGLSVPNSMEAASWFFDSLEVKKYDGNTVTYEYNDPMADFVVGIKKTVAVNTDWTIFNGFKLYYVGTTTGIESVESKADAVNVEYFDLNGVRLAQPRRGVVIAKTLKSDGTTDIRKVVVK